LAYSAKCDTASATKWWITGTGTGGVNRLSQVIADNPSGVEENDNPGNYQPWSTFMTEVVEDGIYQIHLPLDIGDGSTATTLVSKSEEIYSTKFQVRIAASFTGGEYNNNGSENGIRLRIAGDQNLGWGGDVSLYGSQIEIATSSSTIQFTGSSNVKLYDSLWNHINQGTTDRPFFVSGLNSNYMSNMRFSHMSAVLLYETPDLMDNVQLHNVTNGIGVNLGVGITITNFKATGTYTYLFRSYASGGNITSIDPITTIPDNTKISLGTADSWIKEQYTVNIHIADKDGANLSGVSVACADKNSDAAFTTQTTAADGTITEQTVTYKQWVGTDETLTTYSPHTFTISKAGYKTLTLENITIDGPIDWHLELQPYGRTPNP